MILRQFLHMNPVGASDLFGCGRSLSGRLMSTIGFEKRYNAAARIENEGAFIEAMPKDVPPPPPGAAELRAANAGLVMA